MHVRARLPDVTRASPGVPPSDREVDVLQAAVPRARVRLGTTQVDQRLTDNKLVNHRSAEKSVGGRPGRKPVDLSLRAQAGNVSRPRRRVELTKGQPAVCRRVDRGLPSVDLHPTVDLFPHRRAFCQAHVDGSAGTSVAPAATPARRATTAGGAKQVRKATQRERRLIPASHRQRTVRRRRPRVRESGPRGVVCARRARAMARAA